MKRIEEAAKEYALEQGPFCGDCSELRQAFMAGAEYMQHNEWNRVKEVLPASFDSVLVIYPDNVCLIAYYDKYMKVWRDTTNHNEICEPLAWRELPKYNPNL